MATSKLRQDGWRNSKLSIQGEKLSAAEETVEPFLQKLHQVMEEKGLTAEQIYKADKRALVEMFARQNPGVML